LEKGGRKSSREVRKVQGKEECVWEKKGRGTLRKDNSKVRRGKNEGKKLCPRKEKKKKWKRPPCLNCKGGRDRLGGGKIKRSGT